MRQQQDVRLELLIGENKPETPPPELSQALQSVEVSHGDQGRSGFQLSFQVARGRGDMNDYVLLKNPLLKPFNRVILTVIFHGARRPLMDGIITNHQLAPSEELGASTLTVTGEDVSVMMDLEEKLQPHPGQSDDDIVRNLLRPYQGRFGLIIDVHQPRRQDRPSRQGRTPSQHSTDLTHIQTLAQRHSFVFYITPGPGTGKNTAYWGPPQRSSVPQRALSVDMGPNTNVESISFQYNAMAPNQVSYRLRGREETIEQSDREPLARDPAPLRRNVFFSATRGLSAERAQTRAQAMVNQSVDEVVTASGELDALRYGELLKPRGVVDLRGVGHSYDGTYYVKSVSHRINLREGEYKQSFRLAREGLGPIRDRVQL
jgi:hypothetical protein